MQPGTQIIYIPSHAKGDSTHKDCEEGFVVSIAESSLKAWCRFWCNSNPEELRTKANSEFTPLKRLIVQDTRPQQVITNVCRRYGISLEPAFYPEPEEKIYT